MNEFETKMNALRLQFKAERLLIQKDCNRAIGHLNNAIGQVDTPEAREALWAEKQRVYESTRQAMKFNRLCYMQQLEMLEEEYRLHLDKNPSNSQLRRIMALLCRTAEANGQQSITISFGDNRHGTVSFD